MAMTESLIERLNILEVSDATLTEEQKDYFKYKMLYKKAKIQRKLRLLTACDDTCIEMVAILKSESQPQPFWKFCL